MLSWRRTISLLLILSAISFSGCRSTHAQSALSRQSTVAKEQAAATAPSVAKHPPRDSAFAIYNNPAYGVSFRYPRNYLLAEASDAEDSAILQAQQELAEREPGSILVATVTIPPDAYPNTTFAGGSLQLVVNPELTPDACQLLTVPQNPDWRDSTGTSTISGNLFHWRQSGDVTNDMGSYTRVYTAFFHSACYEFHLEVTDSIPLDPDPAVKPADSPKILRHLDKIVSSLQIHPPAPSASNHP
jgi:hypothetical protein